MRRITLLKEMTNSGMEMLSMDKNVTELIQRDKTLT